MEAPTGNSCAEQESFHDYDNTNTNYNDNEDNNHNNNTSTTASTICCGIDNNTEQVEHKRLQTREFLE